MQIDYDIYHRYERRQTDWDAYYEHLAEKEDKEWEDNSDE